MHSFPIESKLDQNDLKRIRQNDRHKFQVRAVATGEIRNPNAGEWIIVGVIPRAVKLDAGMDKPMPIAKLVPSV